MTLITKKQDEDNLKYFLRTSISRYLWSQTELRTWTRVENASPARSAGPGRITLNRVVERISGIGDVE